MSIILLASLYIVPVAYIICVVVCWDSLTLQQWGLITQILTVIPSIASLLQILRRLRWEGNQAISDLENYFGRHKPRWIGNWLIAHHSRLERRLKASIIVVPLLFFLTGLVMQLLSTL